MCELPSAAIVSNRCWSVMMNNMSGRSLTGCFDNERARRVLLPLPSMVPNPHLALTRPHLPGREKIEVKGDACFESEPCSCFVRRVLRGREFASREATKCFAIFRGSFFDHIIGQLGSRRSLVPVERLQVIAHELFIKTGRTLPYDIFIDRPEARGIRGKAFIDQEQFAINHAELKFRICDNDSILRSVLATARINFQT